MYEKLKLFQSVLSHNLRDLHIYKGLYGERNIAENKEKLLLNFITNCLPELQWCLFCVLCGFSADLCFHQLIFPPFAFSFKILPIGSLLEPKSEQTVGGKRP